jgi:SAM-dependent methyltransferase
VLTPTTRLWTIQNPKWSCPRCRTLLRQEDDTLSCPTDGLRYPCTGEIWRLLDPVRSAELQPFIDQYQQQRAEEGWGAPEAEYYLGLPFRDTTGKNQKLWELRATHMRRLFRALDPVLSTPGAVILDAGAGSCWLSYRLAELGAIPIALDLNDDAIDGLGVADVYRLVGIDIVTAQAELERLPLADASCDAAVMNGSLHYAADPQAALSEGWRVLRGGGILAVMDSPVYHDAAAGQQMMREWAERYTAEHGKRPASLPGKGYLTYEEVEHGLRFAGFNPASIRLWPQYRGVKAILRRLKLALPGQPRRELATHPMWTATKEA